MKVQCCVCKKVQAKDSWEEAPEHYHDASHTYCPVCVRVAWADIRAFRESYVPPVNQHRRTLRELFQPPAPLNRMTEDHAG